MRKNAIAFSAILAIFVVLAIFYNTSIPLFESPDELEHTAFVAWLADEGHLPVVDAASLGPWRQEGTQPPLYYWLVARLVGDVSHNPADRLATLNPHANLGDPLRPANKNAVLHGQTEGWPYSGNVLFVHLARLVSTLMALGTLVAVYRVGRIVFPGRPWIALGMMGLVAFTPQFLFLSASVNNDNLVILTSSWMLVLLLGWLRLPQRPSWLQLGLGGVLLGLGALSKAGGLLLWPLAAGILTYLAWRSRSWRWLVLAVLTVFLAALAVSGWWFVRNLQLYEEITGTQAHLGVVYRRALPSTLSGLLGEFRGFRYSFWLLFGWFSVLGPLPFYWLMDTLSILAVAGVGLFVARSRRSLPGWERAALVILFVWMVLVSIGVVRWTTATLASQGRLLYPALPAIALFLAMGWAELVPRPLRLPIGASLMVLWCAWAALCPPLILRPAYALPVRVRAAADLSTLPSPLGVRFGDCCELVGYIQSDMVRNQPIHTGDSVPVTLVWRSLRQTTRNYSVFVHARMLDGRGVGQADTFPGNGMYPTSLWQPGEFIEDTIQVPISWSEDGPHVVRFDVGLYDLATLENLPAFAADGSPLEHVFAGEAALVPHTWPEPKMNVATDTVFGEKIRLAGIDLSQTTARPGDVITVTLQWEALDRIPVDYTGFVHLVDSRGADVVQDDHLPLRGEFPTRLWFEGVVVSDPYRLELPADLPAGSYDLRGGLYQLGSGQRLPAVAWSRAESGTRQPMQRWNNDLVELGTLEVSEGQP